MWCEAATRSCSTPCCHRAEGSLLVLALKRDARLHRIRTSTGAILRREEQDVILVGAASEARLRWLRSTKQECYRSRRHP